MGFEIFAIQTAVTINVPYLKSFTIKRIDMASFLKFPKYEFCGEKTYECEASTKNNSYNKTLFEPIGRIIPKR